VIVIDANLLLYAYNADAPEQRAAAEWLNRLLESGETIGLPWVTIWAFIRIGTNSRIWPNPRSAREAFAIVGEWLAQPGVIPLNPGPLHAEILEKLVRDYGAIGPLVTDAVLAALAMEHGAALASSDQGFRRFPDLRWVNALDGKTSF
jgi:toxin-antitoxin system PIN domain toxin